MPCIYQGSDFIAFSLWWTISSFLKHPFALSHQGGRKHLLRHLWLIASVIITEAKAKHRTVQTPSHLQLNRPGEVIDLPAWRSQVLHRGFPMAWWSRRDVWKTLMLAFLWVERLHQGAGSVENSSSLLCLHYCSRHRIMLTSRLTRGW